MEQGDVTFYCAWCRRTVAFDGATLQCAVCGVLKPAGVRIHYANEMHTTVRGHLRWYTLNIAPSRRVLALMKRPRTPANRVALHEAIFNPPRRKPRSNAARRLAASLDDIMKRAG